MICKLKSGIFTVLSSWIDRLPSDSKFTLILAARP